MRFLGIVFLALLSSAALLLADHFIPGSFLLDFISKSYIETFGLLVGLNVTAAIFLLGQMAEIEIRTENRISFPDTKKELKQNIFFLLISFVLSFVLLIVRPALSVQISQHKLYAFNGINLFVLALFLMSLYAIYEVFSAAFILNGEKKSK